MAFRETMRKGYILQEHSASNAARRLIRGTSDATRIVHKTSGKRGSHTEHERNQVRKVNMSCGESWRSASLHLRWPSFDG